MTSNGNPALNPWSLPAGTLDHTARRSSPPRSPTALTSSPKTHRTASPALSKDGRRSIHRGHNGDSGSEDAPNESEAETVVLGDTHDSSAKETRVIKTERDDDDDNNDDTTRLHSIAKAPRPRSLANGRKSSTSDGKPNGAKHAFERNAKSPISTSPSSLNTAQHTKDANPADSASSPTTRGRSSSTVENRKRKLRDDSFPKSIEPPRQKAKTEGLKDSHTHPTSPVAPGLGRPHKRSQSTQSALIHNGPGRRRRELAAISVNADHRHWSDSSSENSNSPQPAPDLYKARNKRGTYRALTSPARAMPKKNVDKFGATRLARESEKGDLAQVQAAYDAAPEELDQVDFAGIAPLQKAALHGYDDVVEFLIQKGCRTDCESNDRDTPLIDAVENLHLDVVRILLDQGRVNPHHQNKKGQRAIDVLDPDHEDTEEIERLLRESMRREANMSNTTDHSEPGVGQQKSASRLLYNEYNTETLIEKAGDGDIAAVGELINSNIKPNIACGVAASRGGHYDILSILLASGLKSDPDPSKHSETPMLVAIGRGHLKIVQLLLEQDTFNPTRRNREGKTYYEISEERRGPKWEQERETLKEAFDNYSRTHKSPRRNKKDAPNATLLRTKRRERSSSPRLETKRLHLTKSSTVPQAPQRSRRLMSAKDMANREVKRRRRVVSDESSDDESEDEVRPPTKKAIADPLSPSDGEPDKSTTARSENHEPKKPSHSHLADSDGDAHPAQKPGPKIRTKTQKMHSRPTPTPDAESADERKPVKKLIKSHRDDQIKRRLASEVSMDDARVKKHTPTPSAKSTSAPPEKASTPESERERRLDHEMRAAEAKRRVAEVDARKRQEEEATRKQEEEEAERKREKEAARKREGEEAARHAAEEERSRRKAEAEAEAKRFAEEAEATRLREEEVKRQAEEEAARQEQLVARQVRISKLPRALQRACKLGNNRPLHFSGEELGISAIYMPLFFATSKDLVPNVHQNAVSKSFIMSFQAVGILGLPELDLAHLGSPYSSWERIAVTRKQRELLLRQYDIALLAQDFRFPMEGTPDFDYAKIQTSIREAREQFLDMDGLYWIEDAALYPEVEKEESLRPLLGEIKDLSKRRQIHICELEAHAAPRKRHRPRKSFMDVMLGQNGLNGSADAVKVNGCE
jgi:ankyrin repeat protein